MGTGCNLTGLPRRIGDTCTINTITKIPFYAGQVEVLIERHVHPLSGRNGTSKVLLRGCSIMPCSKWLIKAGIVVPFALRLSNKAQDCPARLQKVL